MRPSVTVPVLSSSTVSTVRVDSSTSAPLMSTPREAPRPVPTMIAVGVASPSAQGQAMTSTATARVMASETARSERIQNPKVAAAMTSTIGTNTAETRSTRASMGALPPCA